MCSQRFECPMYSVYPRRRKPENTRLSNERTCGSRNHGKILRTSFATRRGSSKMRRKCVSVSHLSKHYMSPTRTVCRVMVPAYDHPTVWQGHASMVHEIANQLPSKPDAIFCSVGGGGLLGGVLVGCKDVGWDDGESRNAISCINKAQLDSQFPSSHWRLMVPTVSTTLCL